MTGLPAAANIEPGIRRGTFAKLIRNPLGAISLAVLVLVALVAIFAPWIAPNLAERVVLQLANTGPGPEYFLGGDRAGRDIFSRLILGTPGMARAALIMAGLAAAIGVTCGLLAGYFGTYIDVIGAWVFNVLMAVPAVVILISIYTVVGATPEAAMAVFGVLCSAGYFWLTRNLVTKVRSELYVDAAKVSGSSPLRIMGRHILVAVRAPIIIMTTFVASAAIGMQAGLEFLGLGSPNTPTWGGLLGDAFNNIYVSPLQILWPGLTIGITTAALVLVGNALSDVLGGTNLNISPRARKRANAALAERLAAEMTPDFSDFAAEPTQTHAEPSPDSGDAEAILTVRGVTVAYQTGATLRKVVDDVSFEIRRGEVLGLVGESGSGKSQTAFSILGLLPDTAVTSAREMRLGAVDLLGADTDARSAARGRGIAYVPQEPMSNLDPTFRVGAQLVYGIRAQRKMTRSQAKALAIEMLGKVGISDPERTFRAHPHEISGGMAQRVLIAGAIACEPALLIADEPTTALDVTVQAEVLDLLRTLQQEFGMAVLLVTHNFGVVAESCDRVAVMQHGRIIETGAVRDVFSSPKHTYTRSLLDSILELDPLDEIEHDSQTHPVTEPVST